MKLILLCAVMVSVSLGQPSKRQRLNQNDGTLSDCGCGSRNSGRIVGGKETGRNEYPWMVVINCGPDMCGGSIITEYHVLTAAHCTLGLKPNELKIFVGRHNISSCLEGVNHSVKKIIRHKDFKENPQLLNDISVLVTKSKITFNQNVGRVCLPRKRFNLVGQKLKVTGWGVTLGTGDENILHEADLSFVPLDECKQLRPHTILKKTYLCTQENNQQICHGDSGGPLIYLNTHNNRYTQVAVASFGDIGCTGIIPSVNTDVFSFMDWILATISESMPGVKACAGN